MKQILTCLSPTLFAEMPEYETTHRDHRSVR
jgi:hypothetical protein